MWIKICGNTSLRDARMAASLGADALGFVLTRSRRRVTAEQVAVITPHLPEGVERIGVFDTQPPEEIAAAVRIAGLTGVQMHAPLSADIVRRLTDLIEPGITLVQAVHWSVAPTGDVGGEMYEKKERSRATAVEEQIRQIDGIPEIRRTLIDSRVGAASGGTGVPFNWYDAAAALGPMRGRPGLIVAGGLRPENVVEAIAVLAPWGVDVASGVEASPGVKSEERLEAFFRNARSAVGAGVATTAT